MHSPRQDYYDRTATLALGVMLIPLWLVMHGYHGLIADAQIYAFQAMARIRPQLAADLYLQNTSQDQFTVFSPFYAFFITQMGLEAAARLLTLIFTAWLFAAAWNLARVFTDRPTACLVVAFLVIVSGDYGAAGVFQFSENYLTARLPAEAMIISALVCHFRGRQSLGLALSLMALLIHPLMALPGCLVLICLRLPNRINIGVGVASIVTTLAIAGAATTIPAVANAITLVDKGWLHVIRERSQFLLLPLWSLRDWSLNARPFVCLVFTVLVFQEFRIRKLCAVVMLVGTVGVIIALIGSTLGPIAILLQGQAWRWVWPCVFISALLLPLTVLKIWQDERCGPLCALLLVCGWIFPATNGTACVSLALIIWLARAHISMRMSHVVRWFTALLGVALIGCVAIRFGKIVAATQNASQLVSNLAADSNGLAGLRILALFLAAATWWTVQSVHHVSRPIILTATFLAISVLIWPSAFQQRHLTGSAADIDEFSDWANAIPPTSTVLVAPNQDVGAFVWFTLQRPNYLSLDQSAGVVFSRETAMEVQRRSQVLLPLMNPEWKILTSLSQKLDKQKVDPKPPLSADILVRICIDPQLGFVVSPQKVGFNPIIHQHVGAWKDWNLYDCAAVRSGHPAS
jgi:hypothetical protein